MNLHKIKLLTVSIANVMNGLLERSVLWKDLIWHTIKQKLAWNCYICYTVYKSTLDPITLELTILFLFYPLYIYIYIYIIYIYISFLFHYYEDKINYLTL